ncbi:hypothetical protein [Bifidobacterium leontopitheci]|uniref:Uncharacterized protein n=1 Tax=Bifidobacterium leontopitheci TaxID=2650774 RepID=A0A6I1GKR3_9BIFI|nr:hypothetical protein [Bifidobacterium leontopitheci]KAB7789957.1 hypothetical protein F7D09_1507 [Bifidobacterium leontopitheci]
MIDDIDDAIEKKLDELELTAPSEDDQHFPRAERRYALEQIAALQTTREEKERAIRETTLLEMYLVSMF